MSPRGRALVGSALAVAAAAVVGPMLWRASQAAQLARASEVYEQAPVPAVQRLLIVGDSTAVGTGASAPVHSLAGLIGQAHPRLHIDNRARDGATFKDLLPQLQGSERYDLVLVQAGGNDVIRMRNLDRVASDIEQVLRRAGARGHRVIIMPAGNVGNAAFFVPPLSWLMSHRARVLHEHVRTAAQRSGATYVKLFEPAETDPFVQRAGLHAVDGLHPSDAGYRVWMEVLREQSDLATWLAPSH